MPEIVRLGGLSPRGQKLICPFIYIFILVVEVSPEPEGGTGGRGERGGWMTVIVRAETHERLRELKEKLGLRSLNDVIAKLIDAYTEGR